MSNTESRLLVRITISDDEPGNKQAVSDLTAFIEAAGLKATHFKSRYLTGTQSSIDSFELLTSEREFISLMPGLREIIRSGQIFTVPVRAISFKPN